MAITIVAEAQGAVAGLPATPPPPCSVTLDADGDLMLARRVATLMEQHGAAYPFAAVKDVLADADVTVANMEGTFTDRGVQESKLYTFRTPPRYVSGLAEAGINVVSLGNNHAMDFGWEGLLDTLSTLDSAGIRHAGAGLDEAAARAPAFLDVGCLRLAFLSYDAVLDATFASGPQAGVARATTDSIRQDVASAKAEADLVIVSLHAGLEYTDAPTAEQKALAHAAMDAGASVVLGSHPHVLQGWKLTDGSVVIYSLGNFVFDLDYNDLATLGPRPFQTIVFKLELTREGVTSVSIRPVFIDPGEDRPTPASAEQTQAIDQRLTTLSGALP